MTKKSSDPKILLDCDVIIHFIKAGKQLLLPKIYPGRFVILDKIYDELMTRPNHSRFFSGVDLVEIGNEIGEFY